MQRSLITRNGWKYDKTRKAVLARDGHRCQLHIPGICTGIAEEVDHIRPRGRGLDGGDEMDNLRSVCKRCHLARGMDESGRAPGRFSYGGSRVVTRDYSKGG